jgi:cell division septal protein FtsQ
VNARPSRRAGGPIRRTRTVRRASARLTPSRAGAALAMLATAAAIYGLAATSAFGFARLQIEGATITTNATVRSQLDLPSGINLFEIATEPLEVRLLEIPAIAKAEVSIGLPNTVAVRVEERIPILVWQTTATRFLADDTGLLFAVTGASPPASLGPLPVITDGRIASKAFEVGDLVDPVDLDVSRRLASLSPAQVGSATTRLRVTIDDRNGFVLRTVPSSWAAIFGFYGLSLRTPDLVPGQVQLLGHLLAKAGESTVETVILADDRDGTYIPRPTPKPSASPTP